MRSKYLDPYIPAYIDISTIQIRTVRRVQYFNIEEFNPHRWRYFFRVLGEPAFVELMHPHDKKVTRQFILDMSKDWKFSHNTYIRSAIKSAEIGPAELTLSTIHNELRMIEESSSYRELLAYATGQDDKAQEWMNKAVVEEKRWREEVASRRAFVEFVGQDWVDELEKRLVLK